MLLLIELLALSCRLCDSGVFVCLVSLLMLRVVVNCGRLLCVCCDAVVVWWYALCVLAVRWRVTLCVAIWC